MKEKQFTEIRARKEKGKRKKWTRNRGDKEKIIIRGPSGAKFRISREVVRGGNRVVSCGKKRRIYGAKQKRQYNRRWR